MQSYLVGIPITSSIEAIVKYAAPEYHVHHLLSMGDQALRSLQAWVSNSSPCLVYHSTPPS